MHSTEFFFLRPYWLLLAVPALGLVWLAMRGGKGAIDTAWSRLVDPHLLAALAVSKTSGTRSRWLPAVLGAGLLAATVAMAGPTWQKIALPSYQSKLPVVVAMSLAQSMNADDIKPSRLVRAGHKLRDILARQDGGDVGFVIYSDRPFTAAPLTEDGEVIRQMLPELSTNLMPVLGNRADLTITKATDLLKDANAKTGNIILLADSAGSNTAASIAAARAAHAAGYKVDVIGIGTPQGATLRTASGEPITGANGTPMKATFDADGLRQIATAGDGVYTPLTANNTDVSRVLPKTAFEQPGVTAKEVNFKADGWADMGYWLLIIPVLLAPFAFRRNVVLMLPLAFVLMAGLPSGRAEAATFEDLWKTPDQQGATAFATHNYKDAAKTFENDRWRAASLYRGGDYANAAQTLAAGASFDDSYNRGNALAKSGDLKGALGAYDQALKLQPGNADAKYNRDLVAKLLEQQKQKQQQQQNQQQSKNQQQNGGQSQDQKQADQKQQNGGQGQDQKQADQKQQQNGGQQGQDQKQADQKQQNGGQQGQDQKQADQKQQQNGGQNGQDQKQADQKQQQNGGQQGQDQKQADQKQQQNGGQQGQDQKQADQKQQNGGQKSQDQKQGSREQTPEQARAQNGNAGEQKKEESAFRKAMDAMLKGNAGDQPKPEKATEPRKQAASHGITEKEQANEQMLRSVPDDASGLLRARIRQYYARYR